MLNSLKSLSFPLIAPSILSADFSRLGDAVRTAADAGAKVLHLDIMDGNFVPNITFGPKLVGDLRSICPELFFDVHLMLSHPLSFIGEFADAGADAITIHCECEDNAGKCLDEIGARGLTAGISLKPATPSAVIHPLMEKLGLVLIMTVEPGFGGQSMIVPCLEKIAELRRYAEMHSLPVPKFSVDGGISEKTAAVASGLGADILVAGSAFYCAQSPNDAFAKMSEIAMQTR